MTGVQTCALPISDEARNSTLVVGGTNSAIRKIIAPLVQKNYIIFNNTSGGYAITIGGSSGTVATIPNGVATYVYCDGSNFFSGVTGTGSSFVVGGSCTATSFTGAGTGLTGTASGLSIGGNAATASVATVANATLNGVTFNNSGSGGS